MSEMMPATYAREIGDRLRLVRKRLGLALHAVEAASEREFRASVLGAYERGERAISVPRLQRLAEVYGVAIDQLLPGAVDDPDPGDDEAGEGGVSIDLTHLDDVAEPDGSLISRYLRMIQVQRQDFNGRVLTVRKDDLRTLACLLDTRPETMSRRLEELGLRR